MGRQRNSKHQAHALPTHLMWVPVRVQRPSRGEAALAPAIIACTELREHDPDLIGMVRVPAFDHSKFCPHHHNFVRSDGIKMDVRYDMIHSPHSNTLELYFTATPEEALMLLTHWDFQPIAKFEYR